MNLSVAHKWIPPLLWSIIILAVACTNPFSTREAEKPDIPQNQDLTLQLDPDSLIKKMELAFSQKQKESYADLFIDDQPGSISFTFLPQQTYLDLLSNWTLLDEEDYFNHILQSDVISLKLDMNRIVDWLPVSDNPDTLQASYNYSIQLNFNDHSENYVGESLFKIVKEQYYYIFSWTDYAFNDASTDSTWSKLKYDYRYR